MGKKKLSEEDQVISFSFGGREYQEEIEGELTLQDLSVEEVKQRLNEVTGKFAYWSRLLVRIKTLLDEAEEDLLIWNASKYLEVDKTAPAKATETWKKQAVLMDHASEYKEYTRKIRDLKEAKGSAEVLVESLEMQSSNLRGVLRVMEAEIYKAISPASVKGRGSLEDF